MFLSAPDRSAATEAVHAASAASQGFTMNLTKVWAWRPDVFEGFAALRAMLTDGSALSKRDLAVLVAATAAELGDAYCALAWGEQLAGVAGGAVASAVILGEGAEGLTERDGVLAAWARRVVADPNGTARADVEALRAAGLGDREIVEATVFIAFRLAFSTVNDALGAVADRELVARVPAQVRGAVAFGRLPADLV